jgi:hypothetical protein
MIELVYVSQAKYLFQESELKAILDISRKNNIAHGLTGMLLYDDGGTFIQVLEGEQKQIDELYAIISQDIRHTGIGQLSYTEITERNFPDWSMGYKRINAQDTNSFEGYSTFLEDVNSGDLNPNFALEMLKYFTQTSG